MPLIAHRKHVAHLSVYLDQVGATPVLTPAEERALVARMVGGDPGARQELIYSNLLLVVNIAKGYLRPGWLIEDLIEDGTLGLIRAVDKMDPTFNVRFNTYAYYWINQSIRRAIVNAAMPIRVPAHIVQIIATWRRESARLRAALGRGPTTDEIARAAKVPPKTVPHVLQALSLHRLAPGANEPGNDWTADESIVDPRPDAATAAGGDDGSGVSAEMRALLDCLGADDRRTIGRLYGLDGAEPRTRKQVAAERRVSPERVSQLERRALDRLRVAARRRGLGIGDFTG